MKRFYSFLQRRKFKKIGVDVFIDERAYFRYPERVVIGSHCAFDNGLHMTCAAIIGSYVHIGPHVSIIGGKDSALEMGDFSTIAAGARVICRGERHLGAGLIGPTIPSQFKDELVGGRVLIQPFANILTNAVLFPGFVIGEGAVIGAGSVLNHDAEPWTVYLGNPARKIKLRDPEVMRLFSEKIGLKK